MKAGFRNGWLMAAFLLVGSLEVGAQPRWGSAPVPRAGACFYENTNFRGQYFCVRSGESLPGMPGGENDRVSSIQVFGNAEVLVFRDTRYRGASGRFVTSVRNLKLEGWNDAISSFRVTNSSMGWGRGERPPIWGNAPMPREGACFFADTDYRGQYFCMPRGTSYDMVPPGFNDRISSIRIIRASVMIFVDRDYSGRSARLNSDVSNLRGNWRDAVSSIRVY